MYLTSVWDSACLGLFENFLFNCTREREHAKSDVRVTYGSAASTNKFLSVWDWSKQFSSEDISLFNNPLYKTRTELNLTNGTDESSNSTDVYALKLSGLSTYDAAAKSTVLRPVVRYPLLKLWSHCYLRWLTPVQILSGGTPSEYLQQCILVEEILYLQHKIKSLESATPFSKAGRPKSSLIFETSAEEAPPPPPRWSNCVTSSFPYSPRRNPTQLSYFETPISVYLQNSFVYDGLSMEDSCSLGPDEVLS
jgi:myotubularin-related protein 10/11/12